MLVRFRYASVPISHSLISRRGLVDRHLSKRFSLQLQTHWKIVGKSAGNRNARQTSDVGWRREYVSEIHGDRVIELVSKFPCRTRGGRAENDVDLLESLVKFFAQRVTNSR